MCARYRYETPPPPQRSIPPYYGVVLTGAFELTWREDW